MRVRMRFICGLAIAAAFLALTLHRVEAKTIYIAVSNPDMSFLSGGVAKYQGYFQGRGLGRGGLADERQRFGSGIGCRQRRLQFDPAIRRHGKFARSSA